MPRIRVIPLDQAPDPPRRMTEIADEISRAITILPCGSVLALEPDADETLPDLRAVVEHVATKQGIRIDSWTDAENDYLYVRRC